MDLNQTQVLRRRRRSSGVVHGPVPDDHAVFALANDDREETRT